MESIERADNAPLARISAADYPRAFDQPIRPAQLERLRRMLHVGTGWFDSRSGWTFDTELLQMWGLEPDAAQHPEIVGQLIVPPDRSEVVAKWEAFLRCGGKTSAAFRIRHGGTGAVRHLRARWAAELNPDGRLVRATVIHTDVTDEVGALVMATDWSRRTVDRVGEERDGVANRLARLAVEQRELIEQLASTEARERALLAEAVHDDPLQLISVAILRIDSLKVALPESSGVALEQIAGLLEDAVERLRQLMVALNPPDLGAGLGIALARLGEGIFVGTSTSMQRRGPTDVPLSPTAKAVAYRIMREAMVNARKHAMATHVCVSLEERPHQIVLTVTDDGIGSDSLDAGPGHVGLATMRARAESSGAALSIRSRPGRGTRVQLQMPSSAAEGASPQSGITTAPNRLALDRD